MIQALHFEQDETLQTELDSWTPQIGRIQPTRPQKTCRKGRTPRLLRDFAGVSFPGKVDSNSELEYTPWVIRTSYM